MPIIQVKVSTRPSAELSRKINTSLLELTTRILRKDPRLTAVVVEQVDPQHWFVGGESLASAGKASFYMDIKVVDETNTKAEKAAYIAAVFSFFSELLGDLHEESYVYVQDVRAAAYGFGGKTQEYRHQHA